MVANMRLAIVGSLVGAAAAYPYGSNATSSAEPSVVYTTKTYTAITTYCPGSTTLTYGPSTYTVTEPTTLTIPSCTVTEPVGPKPTGDCHASCEDAFNKCVTAPNSNKSYCAAERASCQAKPCSGAPAPDACASKCTEEHNACLADTKNPRAFCAGTYAECLGFNPYPLTAEPTACSTTSAPAYPEPTKPAGDACASKCNMEHDACLADTKNPRAFCAGNYAKCLGFNPYGSAGLTATPTACSSTAPGYPEPTKPAGVDCSCFTKHTECQNAPGANQSECTVNLNECLGYNAFTNGQLNVPAECSAPSSTTAYPGQPTHPAGNPCDACTDAFNACVTKPDSNKSFCASERGTCWDKNHCVVPSLPGQPTPTPSVPVSVPGSANKAVPAVAALFLGVAALL